jgi:hypothetical protein
VESLLEKNPLLVNKEDDRGLTPIFTATMRRNHKMVKFLIDKGALVRVGDSNLRAIIHYAGFMNDIDMVMLLIEKSAPIDTRAIGAATPLIHSSLFNRIEMRDVSWVYFDLSFHPPKADFSLQGCTPIYSMQDRVDNLSFVLNDDFERNYSGLNLNNSYFPNPEQPVDVEGLKVTVIRSYQHKKGYFIECDVLRIFWLSGLSDDYNISKKDNKAIEFVKENFPDIDLLILGTPDGIGPEKGNGIREAYLESMDLNPEAVFFMGKEPLERRIRYQIRRRIQDPGNIYCSGNPGDRFFYIQRKIKSSKQDDFPVLKGHYLGQKPPGMKPELFAPGIVSTKEYSENSITFSPAGDTIYFTRANNDPVIAKIMVSRKTGERWTFPEVAAFSGQHIDLAEIMGLPITRTISTGWMQGALKN